MKYAIFAAIAIIIFSMAGCQSGPRVYVDQTRTCSYDTIDELIICKD